MRRRTAVVWMCVFAGLAVAVPACGKNGGSSESAVPIVNEKGYISIRLSGDYDFQKVGIGDLDGDGVYEYVIKQPNFNTDPYQRPGYWKKSPTTYKIEAYRLDGKAEVYCKAGEGDPRDEKGLVIAVVDCLGDYREEVITSLKGELRIYSTRIPATESRAPLMEGRQYRLGVVAQTMGYYYPAQLGKRACWAIDSGRATPDRRCRLLTIGQ